MAVPVNPGHLTRGVHPRATAGRPADEVPLGFSPTGFCLLGGAVRAGGGRQPAAPVAAACWAGWCCSCPRAWPGPSPSSCSPIRWGAASGLVLARLALALPDQAAGVGPVRRDPYPGPGRSPRQPTAVPGVGLPCQPQRPGPGLAPPGCLVGRLIQYARLRALLGRAELAFFHGGGPDERGRRTSADPAAPLRPGPGHPGPQGHRAVEQVRGPLPSASRSPPRGPFLTGPGCRAATGLAWQCCLPCQRPIRPRSRRVPAASRARGTGDAIVSRAG
jgi:hypothetical protein